MLKHVEVRVEILALRVVLVAVVIMLPILHRIDRHVVDVIENDLYNEFFAFSLFSFTYTLIDDDIDKTK